MLNSTAKIIKNFSYSRLIRKSYLLSLWFVTSINSLDERSMKAKLSVLLAAICLLTFVSCNDTTVKSPDGKISFELKVDKNGVPQYSVNREGKTIIENSKLGFILADNESLANGFKIKDIKRASTDTTWEQVWGESRYVRDNHNEMLVSMDNGKRLLDLRVRIFNDGFGFRYEFPEQDIDTLVIMDELTEFSFAQEHQAWWISRRDPYYEGYGNKTSFSQIDTAYTPFTIEGADGKYYAIHEAALLDYAKMNLIPLSNKCLEAELTSWKNGVKVYAKAPFHTPWRTVTMTDTPGGLQESKIMLNLNEPNKIEDTSWIRPSKYIGIWWVLHKDLYTWYYGPRHGANTKLTKEYIDFAAENGIGGVLVEGWNLGWDGNWMKNSTGFDFVKAYPDYNFDEVMRYAASKGVQMIIHNETAANTEHYFSQIDEAYALYQKYGMHYVKTGNVNLLIDGKEEHDGQYGVNRLHAIVEKAAEYQICIDEHEPVVPTGIGRTWPNLMTHEAIRGQEHDAWEQDGGNKPEHSTVIPFIRGLAGPSDYTFGTFDFSNPNYTFCRVQTTLAKQLAQYVTIYSPLQMASDAPEAYRGHKAFDFIKDVPVDWEESHTPQAVIGDYIVTVRKDRNSQDWYLGAVTDEDSRTLEIPLDFLSEGTTYTAMIYADGPDADWQKNPTSFEYTEKTVTSSDTLTLKLATSGGCAIRFAAKLDK